jgi:D-alanyl-D-alanine dipeptidase
MIGLRTIAAALALAVTGFAAPAVSSARPNGTTPPVPPVSAAARQAGLVDVRTVVPDAIIDLRYATKHNFTGVRLYPRDARCLVHKSMRPGLKVAAKRLRRHGDVLVFWDCYRPHHVQVRMYRVVPNPNWVAKPGPYATSHEAARSVDVTIARAHPAGDCPSGRVQRHCLRIMGTGFDNFTPRAYAYATTGVGPTAQANRARLRRAMEHGGLDVYRGEWWHFDGPGALVPRPRLHVPVD